MGQDFPRRVEGYNRPFIVTVNASTARNAGNIINAPAGPGRVEAMYYFANDNNIATCWQNSMYVSVDGATIYLGAVDGFMGVWNFSVVSGPVFACAVSAVTAKCIGQLKVPFDYESSFSAGIYNTTSPDPTVMGYTIFGRCGR